MVNRRCLAILALAISRSNLVASEVGPASFFNGTDNQAYLDWLQTVEYQAYEFIPTSSDPNAGAAIHWSISSDEMYVDLAVAVRATGWVGFGLSEAGGMRGADMMIFEARNPTTVIDAYVQEERQPLPDDCQDWQFVDSRVGSGFLIVEVRRKLITGDSQDKAIINDSNLQIPITRVISAWGDTEQYSYHGPNRARSAVRWFNRAANDASTFKAAMDQNANGTFFIGAKDYSVKPVDTEYARFCVTGDDLRAMGVPIDEGATVIGFEPVVTSRYVHHFTIYGGESENNDTPCGFTGYSEMSYLWAPGDPPLEFPKNVGGVVGGDGFRSFSIEIHYDNPELVADAVDSSGVSHYWSHQRREHEVGVLQLGDPFVFLRNQSVGEGLMGHRFSCPGSCTSTVLDAPVTVLRELHHMHQSGTSSRMHVYRNETLFHHGSAQYFEFSQQGAQVVLQEPYTVMPGDSFDIKCFYRNSDNERIFGLTSRQEMCIVYLMYYPRKSVETPSGSFPWLCAFGLADFGLEVCDAAYDSGLVVSEEELERTFGAPSVQCDIQLDPVPNEPGGSLLTSKALRAPSQHMAVLLSTLCAFAALTGL